MYPLELLSQLHMNWLLGDSLFALPIALALLFLIASGLVLCWPRQALGIRGARSTPLFWLSTHRTIGVIAALFLLLPAISGTLLAGRGPAQAWLADNPPVSAHTGGGAIRRVGLQKLLDTAASAIPDMTPVDIRPGRDAVLVVLKSPNTFITGRVWLDAKSGALLRVQNAQNAPRLIAFYDFLLRLHEGLLGGVAGRLVMFCIGLVVAAQSLTGGIVYAMRWARHPANRRNRLV
jgi:vanillate O-demethylase ferredoxin subunit